MKKNANSMNKMAAIFVALLFIGSMAGAMLYSEGADEKKEAAPPSELIVSQLSDAQRSAIISRGHVLIEASIPKACDFDCFEAKRVLEELVKTYNPAAYLLEKNTEGAGGIKVSLESYMGKKPAEDFNTTAVEDFICNTRAFRINACVIRSIDFGGQNGIPQASESENSSEPKA